MKTYTIFTSMLASFFCLSTLAFPQEFSGPELILPLYQLMKDVHELFEKAGIEYYVDGGTLIGAARHKGIIPWDNDIDICVNKRFEEQFLALQPLLEKLGYQVKVWTIGYQVVNPSAGYAGVDIWLSEQVDDRIEYERDEVKWVYGKRGEHPIHYLYDELYPLKLYKFGEFHVWGANEPNNYLAAYYGDDWATTARFQWEAHRWVWISETVLLTDEQKTPAQPTSPLKNSVAELFE